MTLKREVGALCVAYGDLRTPLAAKCFAFVVIAYALSPIDLIPDFVPVLGLLDDLLLVPVGIWIVRLFVPPELWIEYQARGRKLYSRGLAMFGAAIVFVCWMMAAAVIVYFAVTLL